MFTSDASNLVPGTQSCPFHLRMYLYDLSTDAVSLVSPDEAGNQCAGNGANLAAVSEDGRYVAFQTDADLASCGREPVPGPGRVSPRPGDRVL